MRLYHTEKLTSSTCITVGNFDGVHLGHLKILKELKKLSNGLSSGLLSFNPHPKSLFGNAPSLITPFRQQYQALKKSECLNFWYLQKFNNTFANQSVEEFTRWLMQTFNPKIILVGDDFRFAKNRSGDFQALKSQGLKHGFEVHCVKTIYEIDSGYGQAEQTPRRISSTWLRQILQQGDVTTFHHLTKRHFELSGCVIHGKKLARTLGFPTANIVPKQLKPQRELALKFGVYQVQVFCDDRVYQGIANWGVKPTIKREIKNSCDLSPLLEVHLLDVSANQNFYGRCMRIEFIKWMRSEMKFDGVDALKKQIADDIKNLKALF